jgi:nickel-dependent lactate racemase
MANPIIQVGTERIELRLAPGNLVTGKRDAIPTIVQDVQSLAAERLETPSEFPALRLALTPDDHLCIVTHEETNGIAAVMSSLFAHLQRAGVKLEQVTVLVPPRRANTSPAWVSEVQAQHLGFQVVEHSRTDEALAYLASTKAGRRIYLNRHIVDADQLIVVGNIRFDSVYGICTGLAEVFPGFSDAPTFEELSRQRHAHSTGAEKAYPIWKEAEEVGWLLGMPFVIAVAEGPNGTVCDLFAGSAAAVRTQAETWLRAHGLVHLPYQVDLVIGTLASPSGEQHFGQVAEAAFRASKAVHQDGVIAILSTATGSLPAGADVISSMDSIVAGLTQVKRQKEVDALPWWHLAYALEQAKVYVASHLQLDVLESLFVVPMDKPDQVQHLVDKAKSVLVVEGLDRVMLEVSRSP